MNLQHNKKQEVNKAQYLFCLKFARGLFAHKTEDGKYFIKPLLFMGYKKHIEQSLAKLQ